MAQIWIKGKVVTPSSDDELIRLLAYADPAPPDAAENAPEKPSAKTTPITPGPVVDQPNHHRFHGQFALQSERTQAFLKFLAGAFPRPLDGGQVTAQLQINTFDLRGLLVSLSRRYGRNSVVRISMVRKGHSERTYSYKLTPAVHSIAKEEGWK